MRKFVAQMRLLVAFTATAIPLMFMVTYVQLQGALVGAPTVFVCRIFVHAY
jgi:hypothetical protein